MSKRFKGWFDIFKGKEKKKKKKSGHKIRTACGGINIEEVAFKYQNMRFFFFLT